MFTVRSVLFVTHPYGEKLTSPRQFLPNHSVSFTRKARILGKMAHSQLLKVLKVCKSYLYFRFLEHRSKHAGKILAALKVWSLNSLRTQTPETSDGRKYVYVRWVTKLPQGDVLEWMEPIKGNFFGFLC